MKHKTIPEEVCAEFYSWQSHSQNSWTLPSGSENETVDTWNRCALLVHGNPPSWALHCLGMSMLHCWLSL